MRIVLAGFGTRGDVQPIVALAQALSGRGHTCSVFVPPNIAAWVKSFGLDTTPVGMDYEKLSHATSTGRLIDVLRALPELRAEVARQGEALEAAASKADVIVGASVLAVGGSLADRFGIPYVYFGFSPSLIPSREHPSPVVKKIDTPRWFNALSWILNEWIWRWLLLSPLNLQRRVWKLAPVRELWPALLGDRTIIATEPTLAPLTAPLRPMPRLVQTGAIFLPEASDVSAETERFLASGSPPVFIGFGSMGDRNPRRTAERLLEAVRLAGVRALVSRGWAGLHLERAPEGVLFIGPEPHGKLFPRVAAVMHHGGSGTTHLAMKSGVPQILMPHLLDQYYWAHHVGRIGIGLELRERFSLDARAIAASFQRCLDDGALRGAAKRQAEVTRLDGLDRAVEIVERSVGEA
jgi:vancomycin aglycone glucosyltransferase